MRLREYMVGLILAAVLVACSAASPERRNADSAGLVATATLVSPGQSAAEGGSVVAALATSQPADGAGLVATATLVAPGQSVAVGGPVTAIHSAAIFELDDASQGPVLVLVPTGSFSVGQGQLVQASGALQPFDAAQLEQRLGAEIDDALGASLAGRPVVVAEQIDATVAGP